MLKKTKGAPPPATTHCCATCHHSEMRSINHEGKAVGQGLACLKNPPQLMNTFSYDEGGRLHIKTECHTPLVSPTEWRGCWERKRPRG